ncbi:hypothetical protein BCR42DRAFT_424266 [Absidia repens]|uniref:C2H2-type domain-containing protein n=1 Tax=Absidia repens TaxID=90262 RepID=A0A1X2I3Y3_9FUNG|nr:hypothetical protein BCR42DRAFT_424266 [Absidia repens]
MQLDLNLTFTQHHHQDQNNSQHQMTKQQQSMVDHTSSIAIPSQQQQQQQQQQHHHQGQNVTPLGAALQQQELDRQSVEQRQEAVAVAAQQVMAQQMAHQVAVVQQMAILQEHQQQQHVLTQQNNGLDHTPPIPQQVMMDASYQQQHQRQQQSSQQPQQQFAITQNQQLQQRTADIMNHPIVTSAPVESDSHDSHQSNHTNYPQSTMQQSSSFTLSLPPHQNQQPKTPTPGMYADKDGKRPFTDGQRQPQQQHEKPLPNKKARRHTVSAAQPRINTGEAITTTSTMSHDGPQSAAIANHHSVTFSDDQNISLHYRSSSSENSPKSSTKPSLQIALPPPPTPAELGLQDIKKPANVDSETTTPDLSRKVAEATSSNVSTKEFDGMSRDQLITRLVELEKEKRTSQRSSPTSLSNHDLSSPLSATASSAATTATTMTTYAPNENGDEDDDDDDDDDDDQEDDDDDDDDDDEDGGNSSINTQVSQQPKPRTDDQQQEQQKSTPSVSKTDDGNTTSADQSTTDTSPSEKPMTCGWEHCGQRFDSLQLLIAHLSEAHVGSGKATYSCEWENCPRNQKPFTKRHKLYNHIRTHTGERPFVCKEEGCEKRFSRPDSLATHIKTHSNIRPFYCRVEGCDKAYYHSRSLKKHERTHQSALGGLPDLSAGGYSLHKVMANAAPPPLTMIQQQPAGPFGDGISPVSVEYIHHHQHHLHHQGAGEHPTSLENMSIALHQHLPPPPPPSSSSSSTIHSMQPPPPPPPSLPMDGTGGPGIHHFSGPPPPSSYVQQPQFIHLASNSIDNTYTQHQQPPQPPQLQQQLQQHHQPEQQDPSFGQSSNLVVEQPAGPPSSALHATSNTTDNQLMSQLFDSANPNQYIHRM